MLVANRQNGERLSLAENYQKKELVVMRSLETFFCPDCKEEVVLKLGDKKIWHFSHRPGSNCQSYYERESEYHLSGKLQLFRWIKQQGIEAEIEVFDPVIRQKPDIVFHLNEKKYALEYQCSPISEELFQKRTAAYEQHGYIPFWIACGRLIKRLGYQKVSMSSFHYLFLRRNSKYWFMPSYCPLTKTFILIHHPIPISKRKALAFFHIQQNEIFNLESLISPKLSIPSFLQVWKKEMNLFKSGLIHNPGARRDPFLLEMYNKRLNLYSLPPYIGLPIPSNVLIETPPLIWQTYLYLDIFWNLKVGDHFSYSSVQQAFNRRVKKGDIQIRTLPLRQKVHYIGAVEEYLQLLKRCNMVRKIDQYSYEVLHVFPRINSAHEYEGAMVRFFNTCIHQIEKGF